MVALLRTSELLFFLCILAPTALAQQSDAEPKGTAKITSDVDAFFAHLGEALLFVLVVIGVFALFVLVGWLVAFVVDVTMRDFLGLEKHYARLATAIIKTFFVLFGLYAAFYFISIEIVSLLTGFGVFSLVIGFAMQDFIANFVSGIILEWCDIIKDRKFYRVAYYGTVAKGRLCAHRALYFELYDDMDDEHYYVPNIVPLRFLFAERDNLCFVQDRKQDAQPNSSRKDEKLILLDREVHNARRHDLRVGGPHSHFHNTSFA